MRSAPLKPSVRVARKLRSISGATGVFLRLALRIPTLDGKSGSGI
jgi:hypothetical protein